MEPDLALVMIYPCLKLQTQATKTRFCELPNLEQVSKTVNLRLNKHGYTKLPTELKPTMKAIATLEVAAFSRAKTNQEIKNVR